MGSLGWNVLGELGEKLERGEDLEIPLRGAILGHRPEGPGKPGKRPSPPCRSPDLCRSPSPVEPN